MTFMFFLSNTNYVYEKKEFGEMFSWWQVETLDKYM